MRQSIPNTEPERKRFFLNPASQNKSVHYHRPDDSSPVRTWTWLAPCREECLFSTSINSEGSPEWQGREDFFERLLRLMVITEVAVD